MVPLVGVPGSRCRTCLDRLRSELAASGNPMHGSVAGGVTRWIDYPGRRRVSWDGGPGIADFFPRSSWWADSCRSLSPDDRLVISCWISTRNRFGTSRTDRMESSRGQGAGFPGAGTACVKWRSISTEGEPEKLLTNAGPDLAARAGQPLDRQDPLARLRDRVVARAASEQRIHRRGTFGCSGLAGR